MPRKIGIPVNPPSHGEYTGVERYVFELLRAMQKSPLAPGDEVILYSAVEIPELNPLPSGWRWEILPWKYKGWTHLRLSLYFLRNAPDILFVPAHEIPFYTGHAKILATVHDIAFALVPGIYTKKDIRRQYWSLRNVLRRAAHILTVSQSTKHDLENIFYVAPARITASPLASTSILKPLTSQQAAPTMEKFHLTAKKYLLYTGRLELKKGIPEFLRIYDEYKRGQGIGDPLQLVLVGKFGLGAELIQKQLRILGRDDIKVLGYLPDNELAALYSEARAFIFPTRYEGFGMPVLEALNFDLPVICTDLAIMREVAGDAAEYAAYNDVGAWLRALHAVLRSETHAASLVAAAKAQREKFSWAQTAEKTWAALRNI